MTRNYFRVIFILNEKIVIGNTQPAHGVPGTCPEGLLKVLKSETCRGLSGDSQGTNTKIDDFTKKLFFRSNSPCITYLQRYYVFDICFCFLQEEQIFKISKRVHPRDVYGTQLRDVPGTKWWDVLGTPVGRRSNMFFKFNSQTYFDRLLKTL